MREFGFVRPVIDDTHYVFGDARLLGAVLKPDGNWESELPVYEAQGDKYETFGCTTFGSLNQIETLTKFLYKNEPNYSERFIYNIAEINPPGADPQKVYEAIRKNGVIPQEKLPVPDTFMEFCLPRPMTSEYLLIGLEWMRKYLYGHDWILKGHETQDERVKKLRAALQFSPIGVSVTAWFEENGEYVDNGIDNNHWCLLYKMDDKYYYVFDSYDHSKKKLPFSHVISFAKRITLSERVDIVEVKKNIIQQILDYILKALGLIQEEINVMPTKKEQLIKAVLDSIGKDASPLDKATDEYGCSESLSNAINCVYSDFPKELLSTTQLKVCLDDSTHFERITLPETGCIIVSPRYLSTSGHCGVFINSSTIVSNNSNTGFMEKNYTWDSWIHEFKTKRGLRIYLWKIRDPE